MRIEFHLTMKKSQEQRPDTEDGCLTLVTTQMAQQVAICQKH